MSSPLDSPRPSSPSSVYNEKPTLLPLWQRGPSAMSNISSMIRISPLKLFLLLLTTTLLGQLLPFLPAYLATPSEPPFFVSPKDYWPLPPALLPPPPPKDPNRIPDILHFVYGFKAPGEGEEPGELLPYYAYLAVRSALVNLKPEKVLFHHLHEPRGPFWELLKPHLTLVKREAPQKIFGNDLAHFAHKADVLRLQVLQEHGGIYLDIDTFIIRPFTPFMKFQTLMAMEAAPQADGPRPALDAHGLCNAIILSRPQNRFIERWLSTYANFNGNDWDVHSVQKPWELARQHPDEITVLNNRAFFWPLWDGLGDFSQIRYVHEESVHDFHASGQYAYHAWESAAWDYLMALTPSSLRSSKTSFGKMAKVFVTPRDDEAYATWKIMKERETGKKHT